MTAAEFRARFAPQPLSDPPGVWTRPTNQGRIDGGRAAQKGGEQFEAQLEVLHTFYRAKRRADVFKLPVPTRATRDGGAAVRLIYTQRQRADYVGYMGGGRVWQMEAKSCAARLKSLPLIAEAGKRSSGFGLKWHQLMMLADGWDVYGVPGVVVWRNGTEVGLLSPDDVSLYARDRGAKNIPWLLFRPVDPKTCDWLAAMDAWLIAREAILKAGDGVNRL